MPLHSTITVQPAIARGLKRTHGSAFADRAYPRWKISVLPGRSWCAVLGNCWIPGHCSLCPSWRGRRRTPLWSSACVWAYPLSSSYRAHPRRSPPACSWPFPAWYPAGCCKSYPRTARPKPPPPSAMVHAYILFGHWALRFSFGHRRRKQRLIKLESNRIYAQYVRNTRA